jgi:hypothetical protein
LKKEGLETYLAGMARRGGELFPGGLAQDGRLWEPFQKAKDKVELYPTEPQVPGCEADWLFWDPKARRVELGLFKPALPSRCGRFVDRQCPLMLGSGAEPNHPECNYWVYPGFSSLVPGLELNPEWQRFDCHRYYVLFQCHLVVAELAKGLGAGWCLKVVVEDAKQAAEVEAYGKLTSSPEAFVHETL